ncbi:hypothetical protein FSP39_006273 [Pinctada imbricata]|uniref:Uncharacterized protein n=1 Tax=Pinctada imbricata TaxID=66713 RepID=A0AA88Y3V7_PINIB|nr:hypothetical protein FSP39_006273 [Pinctada imbricata]
MTTFMHYDMNQYLTSEIATTYEKVATECFGKGNFHDMNCNGTERYMITGLLYGAKNFTQRGNTTCSFRDTNQDKDVCCSFDDGDCLFEIQDFSNRYKYLFEFSGDTFRSRTITAEHHRAFGCNVEMEFSNYVAIKYDCIKEKRLVHICDTYSGKFHGEVHIFTNPRGILRDFCECTVESESKDPLSVYAVDIRLQQSGERNGSCTENNNNFTISDINNDTTLECEDGKAYGQLERIFDASQGIVNVTLNQENINGSIARSQMVWIKINVWSCSCSSTTDNPAIVTPSSENETSDLSPERIPIPTTTTTGCEQSPTESPAVYTTSEPVNDGYKFTITKMLNIHQTDATTEWGKSTAQDSTERITNGFAGDTIGISRETTDVITAVVVIYTALVVTLVALRMCSSRVLKKQETNCKDKSDTYQSKKKGEIDLEEVKCQDETRQTNEIKDDREDDKNAAAVVADVVHDTILNDFDEEQKKHFDSIIYDIPDQIWNFTPLPAGLLDAQVRVYEDKVDIMRQFGRDVNLDLTNSNTGSFTGSGTYNFFMKIVADNKHVVEDVYGGIQRERFGISRYYGGHPAIGTTGDTLLDVTLWEGTIHHIPWLMGGNLIPIYELLEDPGKKENLKAMTQVYMDKAELRMLHYLLNEKIRMEGSHIGATAILTRITFLMNQYRPNHQDVVEISQSVDIPAWFLRNTRLCHRWEPPDTAAHNCPEGTPHTRCARPGEMTPVYIDRSSNGYGCNVSWSLQSHQYDSWFDDVEICFSWQGSDPEECGGKTEGIRCAKVNAFTDAYYDKTYDQGCALRWMLVIPNKAPWWTESVQLCVSWTPFDSHSNNYYCGGYGEASYGKEFCAKANSWTNFYFDKTSESEGYHRFCKLSWGLKYA